MVIQDKQTSFAAPDRRQLCQFSGKRPLAAVDCILDLFRGDVRKEIRRQVGIEIHGRQVNTHDDDSIASLSRLDRTVSLV